MAAQPSDRAEQLRLGRRGFTNRDLRDLTAELRGLPNVSTGQMTYDLRRLRSHQLIERVPRTHRYQVTDTGLHTAMFLMGVTGSVPRRTSAP